MRPIARSSLLLLPLPSLSLDRAAPSPGGGREVDELDQRPADVERNVPHALASLVRQHDGGSLALGPFGGARGAGEVAHGRGRGADRGAGEVEALGAAGGGGDGSSSGSSSGGGGRPLLLLSVRPIEVVYSEIVSVVVEGQGRERRGGGGRVRRLRLLLRSRV